MQKKSKLYLDLVATSLRLVPGATEFVRGAAERFRLGIVSGALRSEIDAALQHTDIGEQFDVVVAAGDIPRCKPDPAGYLAAHAALHARRPIGVEQCVVIEDSLPGLAAARAAGMPCVMLTTSHPASGLTEKGAALVWESFAGHTAAELAAL